MIASASAPAQAAPVRRAGIRFDGRPFAVVAGLAASLPVIVSVVRALADGWMPMGDQGIIATRAFDVLSSHMPLLGQYSEASTVTGQPTYSPGPMLYWLLAVPAHVGSPASLTVTMAAVNVACIVAAVVLVQRRGGPALAVLTAAAIALMCMSLSTESLHGIFNPSAALFPFMLLFPLCWSLACGDYRLLPVTMLVASFVVQCHLGYVAPVVGMLVVGFVGLAVARRRALPAHVWRWVLAAVAVTLVCWSLPLYQQLSQHPGNMGVLAGEVTAHRPAHGLTDATRALDHAIGVTPRWLRAPAVDAGRMSGTSGGDYGDTRLRDIWTIPGALTRVSAAVIVGALAVLMLAAWRRRRSDLVAVAALALALCAALVAIVAKTPLNATNTLGYMLWWGSIAGMWVWVAVIWAAAGVVALQLRHGHPRLAAAGALAGVALVVAAGTAVAAAQKPDTHTPDYRPTAALAAGLDRALAPGTSVRLAQRGGVMVAIEPTIRYTLREHGVRALGHYAARRPGAWYEVGGRRFSYAVSVNGDRPSPYKPARVVVRAVLSDRRGQHPLTATLSPPNARRSG